MRLTIYPGVALLALATTVGAQDTTVKSRTSIKADDAQLVSMTGCLRQDASTGAYSLFGTIDATGDNVETKSRTKVDVDKDETTVTRDARTKGDKGGSVGAATYILSPGHVSLTPHVGKQVQVAAAMVEPGHDDADVTIRDKATVDPENGRDRSSREKTKVEIEKGAPGQFTVVSVKATGGTCAAR
jgi:hypothetical protein